MYQNMLFAQSALFVIIKKKVPSCHTQQAITGSESERKGSRRTVIGPNVAAQLLPHKA